MNSLSLNLALSLAEMETSKTGFSTIQSGYFWIGAFI